MPMQSMQMPMGSRPMAMGSGSMSMGNRPMSVQQFQQLTRDPQVQQYLSQIPPPLQGTITSFLNNPIRSLQTIASLSRMMSMASSMTSIMSSVTGGMGRSGQNGMVDNGMDSGSLNGFNQVSSDDGQVYNGQFGSGGQSPFMAALAPRSKREVPEVPVLEVTREKTDDTKDTIDTMNSGTESD